jgi:hypothetical protein
MTNILDAVEPDAIVRECAGCGGPLSRITKTTCFMDGKFNTDDPIYSRKTVESLLEAHRKQVLLEAAERCGERSGQYKRYAMNDAKKDSHWVVRAIGVDDCEEELRLMAEGDKQ